MIIVVISTLKKGGEYDLQKTGKLIQAEWSGKTLLKQTDTQTASRRALAHY
jgi:hypothetical protein